MPAYFVTNPSASMQRIAAMAGTMRRIVRAKSRAILVAGTPSKKPLATRRQEDGRARGRERDELELGLLQVLGRWASRGRSPPGPCATFRCSQRQLGLPREPTVEPVLDRRGPQGLRRRDPPDQHERGQERERHPGPRDAAGRQSARPSTSPAGDVGVTSRTARPPGAARRGSRPRRRRGSRPTRRCPPARTRRSSTRGTAPPRTSRR